MVGWCTMVGQVPFLLDPIADEDKEDGARLDIGRGRENLEDSTPKL